MPRATNFGPSGQPLRYAAAGIDEQAVLRWHPFQDRFCGGEALVLGVHLAKRHHPAHLVEAAVETFGGLDALLFMASATAPPLGSLDIDAWERFLDVNVRGFIYCFAAALPAMLKRGGGASWWSASRTPGTRGIRSCAVGEPRCARSSRSFPASFPPMGSTPPRLG
jgi:NAD(P)-dependent dehydrogenase (short-subunit alcohol dehydrogenase family)